MADSDAPSAPAAPPPPRSLGETLRAARLAHDLTLEQLSTELRIEAKQLTALEENRFEQIGVPVFVKGYLKQYGQRLGLDVSDLLATYYKQTTLTDVQIQPSRTIKLRDDRQVASWILIVLVLLLIAALGAWWWSGGDFGSLPLTRGPPPESATTAAPAAAAAAPAARPQSQPAAQTETVAPPAAPAAAETDSPEAASAPPTGAETLPAPVAARVEQSAPADDGRAAPVVAIPLEFTFEQESWAEVTDARGERLLFGLEPAGRRVTVRGEPPFAVVLGDGAVVRLSVDGVPYAIPATRPGDPARFSVDIAEE